VIFFLACVAAGLCLAAFEWRRPARWPALRALLVIAAAAALGGLGGKPTRSASSSTDLIVVTPHATQAERDSAQRLLPDARVLPIDSVETASALRARLGNGRLVLIGDGVPTSWWPTLAELRVAWLPPATPLPAGFATLDAPTSVPLGDVWMVRGRLADTADTRAWVVAIGPDARRDSARAASGRFTMALRPRAAGLWTWRLEHRSAKATVGVSVAPRALRTVLLLAGTPTFELTALKRRLAERGERVIVRVRSSKERVIAEYVNLPTGPSVPRVDAASLRSVDHVVVLGRVRDALAPNEAAALLASVRGGLGVVRIIRQADDVGDATFATALVPGSVTRAEEQDTGTVGQTARVRTLEKSAPVPVAEVRFTGAGTALLRDASDRVLAVQRAVGEGRVVGTVVTDAARWQTAGDTVSFDGYWRVLFDAARRPARATPWQVDGDVRTAAERVVSLSRLTSTDSAEAPVVLTAPSGRVDTLTPVRGADDPARRVLAFVPRDTGWYRLSPPDSIAATGVHVTGMTRDAAFEAFEARTTTSRHAARSADLAAASEATRRARVPLFSDTAWLLLLTVAAGTLWLLQRRDG